ncbi:MAG: 50S ribosomal protein L25 [Planctomycetes bacterium]|nr:50S ribosomal protein L25 [Planctomycetota bacterium]
MAILRATSRSEVGTRQVRRLRDKGLTPAVIYGHKQPPQPVTLTEHDLELALQHGERLLEIDVDGQTQNVLVKDVQWDTFGQEVLHVDLCRVSLDERVEVTIPVVLRGTPAGEAEGGVVRQTVTDVQVECPVTNMPEELRVMVTDLQIGQSLHLRDIPLPEGVRLLDDGDTVLCTCSTVTEEAVEEEAPAEVAEPEIIGEKKQQDEQDEDTGS